MSHDACPSRSAHCSFTTRANVIHDHPILGEKLTLESEVLAISQLSKADLVRITQEAAHLLPDTPAEVVETYLGLCFAAADAGIEPAPAIPGRGRGRIRAAIMPGHLCICRKSSAAAGGSLRVVGLLVTVPSLASLSDDKLSEQRSLYLQACQRSGTSPRLTAEPFFGLTMPCNAAGYNNRLLLQGPAIPFFVHDQTHSEAVVGSMLDSFRGRLTDLGIRIVMLTMPRDQLEDYYETLLGHGISEFGHLIGRQNLADSPCPLKADNADPDPDVDIARAHVFFCLFTDKRPGVRIHLHKGNGYQRYWPNEHTLRLMSEQRYLRDCLKAELAENGRPTSSTCRDLEARDERLEVMLKEFYKAEERTVRRIDGP